MARRRRHSELGGDELECILRKLPFLDMLRFKRVCRRWSSIAETYASSSSYRRIFQAPWLVLPDKDEDKFDYEGLFGERRLSFFNPNEKRKYSEAYKFGEDYEGRCVGSSHGWLVLLDKRANLSVLNPFTDTQIGIGSLKRGLEFTSDDACTVEEFPRAFVSKTVVMSDCKFNKAKDIVVLIYGDQKKLAFYSCKDVRFMDLDGAHPPYEDIICKDNKLVCALSETGSVEIWDFNGSFPAKIMDTIPPLPSKTSELEETMGRLYRTQFYLVESCGEILLVVRFVGKLVYEGVYNMRANAPGKTLLFHVYRLGRHGKEWVEMKSLGEEVVFLGRNQSMSLTAGDCPESVTKNSIYFTNDDPWYRNKDVGFYNLEDERVKPLYEELDCMKKPAPPVPFWILPNPW